MQTFDFVLAMILSERSIKDTSAWQFGEVWKCIDYFSNA